MPPRSRRPEPDDEADDVVDLGIVVKPHGLKGEVWLDLGTDAPERLPELRGLSLRGPGGARPASVQYVRGLTGGRAIVKLAGINDRDAAESIRDHVLQVARATLPPPPDGAFYEFQLVGLRVVTVAGADLGRVQQILRTGANDVYETERALVPAIASVVREIDLERGEMVVEDIDGLLK